MDGENWGSWEEAEAHAFERGSAMSAAQRLLIVEEMLELARSSGALQRDFEERRRQFLEQWLSDQTSVV